MSITPKDAAARLLDDIHDALSRGGTSQEAKIAVLRELGSLCLSRAAATHLVGPTIPKIKIKAHGTVTNPKEQADG